MHALLRKLPQIVFPSNMCIYNHIQSVYLQLVLCCHIFFLPITCKQAMFCHVNSKQLKVNLFWICLPAPDAKCEYMGINKFIVQSAAHILGDTPPIMYIPYPTECPPSDQGVLVEWPLTLNRHSVGLVYAYMLHRAVQNFHERDKGIAQKGYKVI